MDVPYLCSNMGIWYVKPLSFFKTFVLKDIIMIFFYQTSYSMTILRVAPFVLELNERIGQDEKQE